MSQIEQFFLRNLAIYATKIENPPLGGEFSQTLVWGKQSVWLSACRTPTPMGRTGRKPEPTLNLLRKRGNQCQRNENEI